MYTSSLISCLPSTDRFCRWEKNSLVCIRCAYTCAPNHVTSFICIHMKIEVGYFLNGPCMYFIVHDMHYKNIFSPQISLPLSYLLYWNTVKLRISINLILIFRNLNAPWGTYNSEISVKLNKSRSLMIFVCLHQNQHGVWWCDFLIVPPLSGNLLYP